MRRISEYENAIRIADTDMTVGSPDDPDISDGEKSTKNTIQDIVLYRIKEYNGARL